MRIWSLHPSHLDSKGLVALWRETLLGKHVLLGKTKGYRNHPQLDRFKAHPKPVEAIDTYLLAVWEEAGKRGYAFDRAKIGETFTTKGILVTDAQLAYEWQHLRGKLAVRDPPRHAASQKQQPLPHPLFTVVKGPVANWEKRS